MRDGGAKIDGYVIEYIEVKPPPAPPAPVEVCYVLFFFLLKLQSTVKFILNFKNIFLSEIVFINSTQYKN